MDAVLRLRELRRAYGYTQVEVARITGIGEKTYSSFETGKRLHTMKLVQLQRILDAYGLTWHEFFCQEER